MIDLSGRHIHIVGGSRGIGRAAAELCAKAGAAVSFSYRANAAAAAETAALVRGHGRLVWSGQADASAEGALDTAMAAAVRVCGPLHGVVVSAGLFEPCRLADMTLATWRRIIDSNLTATFLAVRAAAPHLRSAGGGSIVIYTSTAGQRGSDTYSAYATAKGGQVLFMRSMAKELAADRIRVNCIAPSWTETDMSAETMDRLGREAILAGCPLGRVGLPADVAGGTVYLLSDLAAFVTGSTLTIDGGIDMRG